MPPKVKQMIKEQEEQKIFKEFEELGYEIQFFSKSIHLVKEDRLGFEKTIVIAMDAKWYRPTLQTL